MQRLRRPGAARGRAPPTRRPRCGTAARPRAAAARGRARAPARCSENERSVQSPASGSTGPGLLGDLVVDGVVDDVLAEALLAGAAQVDDRRLALEVAGDVLHEALELVALDRAAAGRRRGRRCSCVRDYRRGVSARRPAHRRCRRHRGRSPSLPRVASALVACGGDGARRRTGALSTPAPPARDARAAPPTPAASRRSIVGIGEQRAAMFADKRFRDLGIDNARLVVPYDAAPPPLRARPRRPLARRGASAPASSRSSRSATRACDPKKLPSVAEFRAAFRAFRERLLPTSASTRRGTRSTTPASRPHGAPRARGGVLQRRQGRVPGLHRARRRRARPGRDDALRQALPPPPRRRARRSGACTTTPTRTASARAACATARGRQGRRLAHRDGRNREVRPQLPARRAARRRARSRTRFELARDEPSASSASTSTTGPARPADRFDSGLIGPDGTPRPGYDVLRNALAD